MAVSGSTGMSPLGGMPCCRQYAALSSCAVPSSWAVHVQYVCSHSHVADLWRGLAESIHMSLLGIEFEGVFTHDAGLRGRKANLKYMPIFPGSVYLLF